MVLKIAIGGDMAILLMLLLLSLAPHIAIAGTSYDGVEIWRFYTGQGFLDISRDNPGVDGLDRFYVAGLSDALNAIAVSNPQYKWVIGCTTGRETRQLTEIFKKWLQSHPERWHELASGLFIEAIKESCK